MEVYHGTSRAAASDIKKNGIKPCGGGELGKGFYVEIWSTKHLFGHSTHMEKEISASFALISMMNIFLNSTPYSLIEMKLLRPGTR